MKITEEPFEEKQSTELAIGSFIVSTLLFVLYIVTNQNSNVLIIAFPFVASTIVLNSIMLIHLIDKFIELTEQRKDIAVKILILLSNIPITFLYYSIVMKV
jgi:UDP-N-acetylmuramyl pentapeptide phosphotransferase/UDP-N-acetylglucosamine-1-phosphate transferase